LPVLFETVFAGEMTICAPSAVLPFSVAPSIVLPLEPSQSATPSRWLCEPSSSPGSFDRRPAR
jgi:hypothetical protein